MPDWGNILYLHFTFLPCRDSSLILKRTLCLGCGICLGLGVWKGARGWGRDVGAWSQCHNTSSTTSMSGHSVSTHVHNLGVYGSIMEVNKVHHESKIRFSADKSQDWFQDLTTSGHAPSEWLTFRSTTTCP